MQIEIVKQDDHYIVKNGPSYFKLGLMEGEILRDIQDQVSQETILKKYNLEQSTYSSLYDQFVKVGVIGEARKERFNIFWIKLPLINPDHFLDLVTGLFSQNVRLTNVIFWALNILVLISGYYFIKNIDALKENAIAGFNLSNVILCYVAVIFCVFLHELGHGFMCKYYKGKVSTIGLMMIFFSPALYCDVSDAWLFRKKKQRIIVSLAGIYVQFLIVAVSMMTWLVTDKSTIKDFLAWLMLANLSMIVSNIIPFIKLDGYWVLSHATGITNLYQKAISHAAMFFNRKLQLSEYPKK